MAFIRNYTSEIFIANEESFITLSDLRKNYTNVQSDRAIFQIEDKIIQDHPSTVFVDISNIMTIFVSPVKFIGDLDDLYMITLKVRNEKKY
ncbi:hypothetical protein [Sphingobacterium faecium]|uniref:hypothetical protein n=1 Tax=Sphingobacterium faecium TaxID=34087 RepID=UPI00320955A3